MTSLDRALPNAEPTAAGWRRRLADVAIVATPLVIGGASSVFTMDQVIAYTFVINGSGGTVNVLRETGVDAVISGAGLVE